MTKKSFAFIASLLLALGFSSPAFAQPGPTSQPLNPALPTFWIVGDSTSVNAGGWGTQSAKYFDTTKINFANRGISGRSSRTYQTMGSWDQVLSQMKKGDFAVFQMGHNDADAINTDRPGTYAIRARGTLPGLGEESEEIDNGLTKQHEVVHTFGWYMRKFINETKAKGTTPIMMSLTVRNEWTDGKVQRDYKSYKLWAEQLAKNEKVMFVDLNSIAADAFDQLGQEKVKAFFPATDIVHGSREGGEANATYAIAGFKGLPGHPLDQYLSDQAKAIEPNTKYLLKP